MSLPRVLTNATIEISPKLHPCRTAGVSGSFLWTNADSAMRAVPGGRTHAQPSHCSSAARHAPQVIPSTFAEDLPQGRHTPGSYVVETAREKGREVAARLASADAGEGAPPALIISADTVVEIDGDILEKPADAADAVRMLTRCCIFHDEHSTVRTARLPENCIRADVTHMQC